MKTEDILKLAGSIALAQSAGGIGSLATRSSLDTWYKDLEKPSFNPPGSVFGPVWGTLYTLMGTAAYLVYEKGWEKKEVKNALNIYFTQLTINTLWTLLFFGKRSIKLGLVDIIILWSLIALTINLFYKVSKTAGYLLIPYILWVSFATVLNFSLWTLNKDKKS